MPRERSYKIIIFIICFLAVGVGLGFLSGTKGLFLKPVTEALNIPRTLYSIQDSIRYIVSAAVNVFLGFLVSKFGIKKLLLFGFSSLIAACIINSFVSTALELYFAGLFLGLGFSFVGTTLVGLVADKWFDGKHKGKITGAILCSNGLGAAAFTPIVENILISDMFGFRSAYRIIAAAIAFVALLTLVFFRDSAENAELRKKQAPSSSSDVEYDGDILRLPLFWSVALRVFVAGAVLQGITGVASAHMADVGISGEFVGFVAALSSVILTVSKFAIGSIHDRFGLRVSLIFCQICSVIAMITLALSSSSAIGIVLAVVYSVFAPFALPLETVMIPLIAGGFFGKKNFGKTLGYLTAVNVVGYAVSGPILNAASDFLGSYVPLFYIFAVLMIVMTVLTFFLPVNKKNEM